MLKDVLTALSPATTETGENAGPSSSDLQRVNILRAKQKCINSSLNKPGRQEDSAELEDTKTVREKNKRELSRGSKNCKFVSNTSL